MKNIFILKIDGLLPISFAHLSLNEISSALDDNLVILDRITKLRKMGSILRLLCYVRSI